MKKVLQDRHNRCAARPASAGRMREAQVSQHFKEWWGIIVKATIVILTCLLFCATAWSQAVTVAQINGSVKDQSEALLPGVEVKVTQTETGYNRTVVTEATLYRPAKYWRSSSRKKLTPA